MDIRSHGGTLYLVMSRDLRKSSSLKQNDCGEQSHCSDPGEILGLENHALNTGKPPSVSSPLVCAENRNLARPLRSSYLWGVKAGELMFTELLLCADRGLCISLVLSF